MALPWQPIATATPGLPSLYVLFSVVLMQSDFQLVPMSGSISYTLSYISGATAE